MEVKAFKQAPECALESIHGGLNMPNPKGGVNPERTNADEAYNRAQFRRQDVLKDREDPQVGQVEDRARAANRRHRTGS